MRQQQSDTKKRPSRFCKFLLLLVGFKLCLLGVVLVEPFMPVSSFLPSPALLKREAQADVSSKAEQTAAAQNTAPEGTAKTPPAGAAFAATVQPPTAQQTPEPSGAPTGNITLDALNRKQEELLRREQDLRALEQELDARLIQMQTLEQRLQTMLSNAEEIRDGQYRHLVDVLANMKARQAAEVLEALDEKIAVRVLAGMRGRQAGEILTHVAAAKAARLAESLARMQLPLE